MTHKASHYLRLQSDTGCNKSANQPIFTLESAVNTKNKATTQVMSDPIAQSTTLLQYKDEESLTHIVNELPADIIQSLMKIAEASVIKSHRISRDEIPDFVQNCLLKLLLQIEKQAVVFHQGTQRYYIVKKDSRLLELERWFGTTAANLSIDRYRRLKHEVDTSDRDDYREDTKPILAPEPSANLEDEIRENTIKDMALFCADAMDDCMLDAWQVIANDNYKNLTLAFTENSRYTSKGLAIADYCQIVLNEKYTNDGKKVNSHKHVCEILGIIIRPENITHKKKKFEQLMTRCIEQKVNKQFNHTTSELLQDNPIGEA